MNISALLIERMCYGRCSSIVGGGRQVKVSKLEPIMSSLSKKICVAFLLVQLWIR